MKMKKFKTEQEQFWAGEFGNEYAQRNKDQEIVAANIALFSKIIAKTPNVNSVIEFGSNIGLNLKAIKQLLPLVNLSAIEINQFAVEQLQTMGNIKVYHQSILDFIPDATSDLAFIKGVLIHLNPEVLQSVYEKLYKSSNRFVCVIEYYNPTPVELPYRGHEGKLFKRDFAGELMDKYPDLKLVDYGFCYYRDPVFLQDDLTWFLMEKRV
jgi:pseudaminic acid biosynthesis-associated methylase